MNDQRWKYLVVVAKSKRWYRLFPDTDSFTEVLNRYGAQGWELAGVAGAPPHRQHLLFKRPA